MKHVETWHPTKYVFDKKGQLRASRNSCEVGIGSRLVADLTAQTYQNKFARHFSPSQRRGRLLDLGCGQVPLYLLYKDFVDEVVCVDWENSLHRNEHLDHSCDLTNPLPFDGDTYDVIILSDVLEHIPNPQNLANEMDRVLKPDGILFLNVPFMYLVHEKPFDYYRYTEFALRMLFEKSGLIIETIEAIGGLPEILADFSAKLCAHFRCGKIPAILIQKVAAMFVETVVGRKISQSTSSTFPLAYFLIARKPR